MNRRKQSQRKLGDERVAATALKLAGATGRMQAKKTAVLREPWEWSLKNLALEAGVDESTLYRKRKGIHVYADILGAFRAGNPVPTKKDAVAERNALVHAQREQIRKLQLEVASLTKQLFALRTGKPPAARPPARA